MGTGREVRPRAASRRTCWSCCVPPRALPAMKIKDIFCHMREDEQSPQLLEAFWEGQPLVGGTGGVQFQCLSACSAWIRNLKVS